jgi:hypothetical protein
MDDPQVFEMIRDGSMSWLRSNLDVLRRHTRSDVLHALQKQATGLKRVAETVQLMDKQGRDIKQAMEDISKAVRGDEKSVEKIIDNDALGVIWKVIQEQQERVAEVGHLTANFEQLFGRFR